MLLNQFSKYMLRGQRQAIIVALLFTMVPFFNWVSVVVIGLVTLSKGAYEGFIILLWASLPYAVFAVKGVWMPLVVNIGLGAFLVWIFAIILHHSAKWVWVLKGISALAIVGVLLVHFFIPHIQTVWVTKMAQMMQPLLAPMAYLKLTANDFTIVATWVSYYATGVQASYFVFTVLTELALARMLQARLFFPGGLMQEWLQLRLDYLAVIVLLLTLVLVMFGADLFKDIIAIITLPFLIVGVSLLYRYVRLKKKVLAWSCYTATVLLTMLIPLVMVVFFVLLATLDVFLPIRKRLAI